MDARLPIPRKVPKRVQKHTRLSHFFSGDSTVSNWFFSSTESARSSPCIGRRYPSTGQHGSPRLRGRNWITCTTEPHASPALESEHIGHEPTGTTWSDVERRVALPFPWIRGRFAVTQQEPSPDPSGSNPRWAWIRRRGTTVKPASKTCFPSIGDDRIHNNIVGCLFSGSLLMIILTIYLALAVSRIIQGQPTHIVLIVVILITTIVFCQYLIRLCMLAVRAKGHLGGDNVARQQGRDDFFKSRRPIRVFLARDEEFGTSNEPEMDVLQAPRVTSPPPAYGLWRGSVRADPNLLHWQRRSGATATHQDTRTILHDPPPTYVSSIRLDERMPLSTPAAVREVRSDRSRRRINPSASRAL